MSTIVTGSSMLSQYFSAKLAEQLFPQNAFYQKSLLANDFGAVASKNGTGIPASVSMPSAGAIAKFIKNPSVFPLQGQIRQDGYVKFDVDCIAIPPVMIPGSEEDILVYDKGASVVNQIFKAMETLYADACALGWIPNTLSVSSNLVVTTGTDTRTTGAKGGSRTAKKITMKDLAKVAKMFKDMDLPMDEAYCLMTPTMYADLLELTQLTDADKVGTATGAFSDAWAKNKVKSVFGFEVMLRTEIVQANAASSYAVAGINRSDSTFKQILSSGITAGNVSDVAIFWHPDMVCRYEEPIQTVVTSENAGYLGGQAVEAYGFLGGSVARTDEKGVVLLVEG